MHLQVLIPVDEFAPCPGRAKVTREPGLKILTCRTHTSALTEGRWWQSQEGMITKHTLIRVEKK